MKLIRCEQCRKVFWAKRSDAKYCDAKCRKRASRGVSTTNYYAQFHKDELEELATVIALEHPQLWRKLETIGETCGQRAVRLSLDLLKSVIDESLI